MCSTPCSSSRVPGKAAASSLNMGSTIDARKSACRAAHSHYFREGEGVGLLDILLEGLRVTTVFEMGNERIPFHRRRKGELSTLLSTSCYGVRKEVDTTVQKSVGCTWVAAIECSRLVQGEFSRPSFLSKSPCICNSCTNGCHLHLPSLATNFASSSLHQSQRQDTESQGQIHGQAVHEIG